MQAFPFDAPYAEDDEAIARRLLSAGKLSGAGEGRIDAQARRLIGAVRRKGSSLGGVEELLHEYSLSTKEGLALMVLAEALLRVPDAATADRLIEEKLGQGGFEDHEARSETLLVNASAWALGVTARIVQPHESADSILAKLSRRLGAPTIRVATRQAMRVLANHFILGQTIEDALARGSSGAGRLYRYSFDMLGEGARTRDDADRYFRSYSSAIESIGRAAGNKPLPDRPGISVKLSALHPRYDAMNRNRVMAELVPLVIELAQRAKLYDLNFTVDAEECDRLELSLDVIGGAFSDPSLADWDGFGLAIQAYQKRAPAVIDWVADITRRLDRRMMVRLVKGAYWDTEIKRAQERGLDDYPVFTRKAMTDLSYEICVDKLLALRPRVFPQFATHNALTVASIRERAGNSHGYEFQRLHGMGEALYKQLIDDEPELGCRVYAPVGGHRDLLAYLVRRLLENGANSSFVSVSADSSVPVETLLRRPAALIERPERARHPKIPRPSQLFSPARLNSRGLEFGHCTSLQALADQSAKAATQLAGAWSIVDGHPLDGTSRPCISPIDAITVVGHVTEGNADIADRAITAASAGFCAWDRTPVAERARALERTAEEFERKTPRLIHLLQVEGGKTLDDAIAEIREAIDFCRYYAAEARTIFGASHPLPGPTGESNTLRLRGRGVFIAISPWNFPLAIFIGQIAAALVSGNTVVAKPAEQTPLIAAEAVRIFHASGIPASALHLVLGDGDIGAALVAHPAVAGVVFTGSTTVAHSINRTLAQKDGPIVPLIAETGGINAMIVDATALPEQVTDDVMQSAFRSAGQRCSALRLLCLQDEVADGILDMIVGAAKELPLGDPRDFATAIGPLIDREAKAAIEQHIQAMKTGSTILYAGPSREPGFYVAPHVISLDGPAALKREVFGPVLHIVRYASQNFDEMLDAIGAMGYGLTLGVHSRMERTVERVLQRLSVGNVYVNRNMIGAVVGVQPFGGNGLSGTGPKAGGPHYLQRFATEQVISINTTSAGGNAALMIMDDA